MNLRPLLFFCLLLISSELAVAQRRFLRKPGDHRAGMMVGFGGQSLLDVKYQYSTFMMAGEYQYALMAKGNWGLHAFVQPHGVFTRYNVNDVDLVDHRGVEFGANMGLQFERHFGQRGPALYLGASSGPHFLAKGTHRQASGPIFSSALFFGGTFRVRKHIVVDLRPGFRHLSNAGIYLPNGGINNSTLTTGVFYHF